MKLSESLTIVQDGMIPGQHVVCRFERENSFRTFYLNTTNKYVKATFIWKSLPSMPVRTASKYKVYFSWEEFSAFEKADTMTFENQTGLVQVNFAYNKKTDMPTPHLCVDMHFLELDNKKA